MRIPSAILILSGAFAIQAQDHLPFIQGTKKAFVANNGNVYSLSLDSIQMIGSDTTYFNYFELDSIESGSDICVGWGGPDCLKQDLPSWFGRKTHLSEETYSIITLDNDTLYLDLDQAIFDTIPFYQDEQQSFSLFLAQSDTMTVLGMVDSVHVYQIIHSNDAGNPIYSDLHGEKVIIGKELGLVKFFQVDSFPHVLRSLELLGDANHEIGLYEITPAIVHDHQVGDIIQIHAQGSNYPPQISYNAYIKYAILEKEETPSHLNYIAERQYIDVYSGETTQTIEQLSYSKLQVIAAIPFESFNGIYQRLIRTEECGQPIFEYSHLPAPYISFCPDDTCWIGIDTNGPQPYDHHVYHIGLWTERSMYSTAAYPNYISDDVDVVYYVKNGIPCGNEVVLGLNDVADPAPNIKVVPNPNSGTFQVIGIFSSYINIYEPTGKLVSEMSSNGEVSLPNLPAGFYTIEVIGTDGRRYRSRICVQH